MTRFLLLMCVEVSNLRGRMGRGVSSGGGQSSLGYLFGADENAPIASDPRVSAPTASKTEDGASRSHVPAGIPGRNPNNYRRADGQNTGNFITDRPSTKVQAAPGGGSSLNYLFGGGSVANNQS